MPSLEVGQKGENNLKGKKRIEISVVISTYNRYDDLVACIDSILRSTFDNFEIVIVEQLGSNTKKKFFERKDNRIRYYSLRKKNASLSKNFGIKKAKGRVVAFTDDDCIVDKDWLKNIKLFFDNRSKASAVFGKVLPYKPSSHKKLVCPCTFNYPREKTFASPNYHAKSMGFGNNFAVKRETTIKYGGFKKWLGPGSIGKSAEDAEFALRLLINGQKVGYRPDIKVWHNRWLTEEEMYKQLISYNYGEIICYGYYFFAGFEFARGVIISNFEKYLMRVSDNLQDAKKVGFSNTLLPRLQLLVKEFGLVVFGISLAYYYSKTQSPKVSRKK